MKALSALLSIAVICSLNLFAKGPIRIGRAQSHSYDAVHCTVCNQDILGSGANVFLEHLLNDHSNRNLKIISFESGVKTSWSLSYHYEEEEKIEPKNNFRVKVKDALNQSLFNLVHCEVCDANITGKKLKSFLEHVFNKHGDKNPHVIYSKELPIAWELKYSYEE